MASPPSASGGIRARFGPYCLLAAERMLLEGERPVRLGSRALSILIALVERAGQNVSRSELMAAVWPDTVVTDSNISVNVAALRKALGDGSHGRRYVISVPGRGYCFVAPVVREGTTAPEAAPRTTLHYLPVRRTELIARDDFVHDVVQSLGARRLLTVTGPPGVGKTSVAMVAAERLVSTYRDGAWWVELAPVSDSSRIAITLRGILHLETRGDDSVGTLSAFLKDKEMLLVLDNCEHVIDGVAELVASIVGGTRDVDILATSREPLRVEGEQVFQLPPLRLPSARTSLTATEALGYSAMQLFVERASAASSGFDLDDDNADDIAKLCRKLDGLPLAIELVAAQVAVFSVEDLSGRLSDRLLSLARGRRAGPARQQTLSAALGWSYDLLDEAEKPMLRALGIFAGSFTIAGISAVTGTNRHTAPKVISELVLKSLVQAESDGPESRFRLLEATRAFLRDKLEEEDEYQGLARRHAEFHRELFEQAYGDFSSRPRSKWLPRYGPQLDNLRSALDWCFSAAGDAALGTSLTISAVPFWMHMSLADECQRRVRQALSCPDGVRSERQDMQLYTALGGVMLEWGGSGNDTEDVLTKASALAERLQDTDYRLRTLSMLWYFRLETGAIGQALSTAQGFSAVAAAQTRPDDALVGDRMLAANLHIIGDQEGAYRCNERVLGLYTSAGRQSDIDRFTLDQRVQALSLHSSILWLRGYPDRSSAVVRSALSDAVGIGHASSICSVLVHSACPLALFMGDLTEAGRLSEQLLSFASNAGLDIWRSWARCYAAIVRCREACTDEAVTAIGAAFKELSNWRAHPRNKILVSEYSQALGRAGRASQGLAELTATIEQCERSEEYVLLAELLRVKAELLIFAQTPQAEQEADRILTRALSLARKQRALSLELRAALSLYRLHPGDPSALDTLQAAYGRFSEGWETADLLQAKHLLTQP